MAGPTDADILEIGRSIRDALPAASRSPLKALDAKAMDFATADADLRAALFRFVDVVPACRSVDDVVAHLSGFLDEVDERPPPLDVAMRMGSSRAGRQALGRAAAAGVRHMAHRFIVGESAEDATRTLTGLWRDGIASSVDLLGEATVTPRRGRALRGTVRGRARGADRRLPPAAGAAAAGARRRGPAPPRQPVREGLRPHAAPAARRAGARQARRRPAAARAPADRQAPRRAPAHRHGVLRLARGGRRARPRAALRARVRRRPERGDRPAGLPPRRPGHPRRRGVLGARDAPGLAARRPAREGRVLGPRGRRGPPARLERARVRGEGRERPRLRAPHRAAAGHAPARARRDRLAQPALRRPRDRRQPRRGRIGRRHRAAGPARPRRRPRAGPRALGVPRPRLLPGRRPRLRHGLPRAAAPREHRERVLPRRRARRRGHRGSLGTP